LVIEAEARPPTSEMWSDIEIFVEFKPS